MSCGVGCRLSSDLVLLWLWHRPVAVAPIRPRAWELPYATGVAPPPNCYLVGYCPFHSITVNETSSMKIVQHC